MLSRKKVLVTGGAGFIGSHLCERLLAAGCDVLCVDNYFTGTKDNIAHLLNEPRFEAMRHDVTFPLYVEVDEIYNLACPASPISSAAAISCNRTSMAFRCRRSNGSRCCRPPPAASMAAAPPAA